MTRTLDYGRQAALSPPATGLVIFLHGYGADGADLLGLGTPLAPHLPEVEFVAPDAPERLPGAPFGFQWFPIPWLDGSSEAAAAEGLARASVDLHGFLDDIAAKTGIAAGRTALVGFSQGTMMALHVAARRAEPLAGVVGFSGRLLAPERLLAETRSRPPVLLIHGDRDQVVPPADTPRAAAHLTAAGFEVQTHVSRGTAHGIAPDGLSLALRFLRERLVQG